MAAFTGKSLGSQKQLPKVGDRIRMPLMGEGVVVVHLINSDLYKIKFDSIDDLEYAYPVLYFIDNPNDWEIVSSSEPTNTPCNHEYKLYQGFTDSYNYCVKCDQKE
jgi:hypothetical protein